jgi:hypothetical protein
MAMASFYGSGPKLTKETVWYPEVIEDWKTWEWRSDPEESGYWKQLESVVHFLIDRCEGKYFVGTPQLGTAGDLLSLLRGMDVLAMDLVDHPEEVRNAIDIMGNTWNEFHEQFYKLTEEVNEGAGVPLTPAFIDAGGFWGGKEFAEKYLASN